MKWTLITIIFLLNLNIVWGQAPNFYATRQVQDKYPGAFATQRSNTTFHKELEILVQDERQLLLQKIQENTELKSRLMHFEKLSTDLQVEVLRNLFKLECDVLNMTHPELIIDEVSIPGYAFFEFDYKVGGAGKVYLNLKKLKETKEKAEFIVLLLHETRHSAQFQRSQSSNDHVSRGFRKSFLAQKELKEQNFKMTFSDFMLLLNEYEAFQFANYIYGALTNWEGPITDMGTLASQFNEQGELRLNILDIFMANDSDPVETFNELAKQQADIILN